MGQMDSRTPQWHSSLHKVSPSTCKSCCKQEVHDWYTCIVEKKVGLQKGGNNNKYLKQFVTQCLGILCVHIRPCSWTFPNQCSVFEVAVHMLKMSALWLVAEIQAPSTPRNLTESGFTIHDGKIDLNVSWLAPSRSDLPIIKYKVTLLGISLKAATWVNVWLNTKSVRKVCFSHLNLQTYGFKDKWTVDQILVVDILTLKCQRLTLTLEIDLEIDTTLTNVIVCSSPPVTCSIGSVIPLFHVCQVEGKTESWSEPW